jgi:hypothetical protein
LESEFKPLRLGAALGQQSLTRSCASEVQFAS